nr:MAG TPA: helix-turn-helix domain protein [Bacteriophage sp.]
MNNFKRFRELNGESQQAIADFLGIERSTYTKYETEQKAPPYAKIEKLAQHWNTTVAILMGTKETENPIGIPDEVQSVAEAFMKLPPAAQSEARAYLDFLKQRYTRKKD